LGEEEVMADPVLYQAYDWEEAVRLFGSLQEARILCDGQWVIFPEAILCLTVLGERPKMPYFEVASRLWWVTDKPPIPREVVAGRNWHPTIHFFVRTTSQQNFACLVKSGPSHQQSYPRSKEYVAALFDLRPAIPSGIWQSLGGFDPGDLDHAHVDASLQRLHGETTTEDRLEILRVVAEYWHGPIGSENGIAEEELAAIDMPIPLRWCGIIGGHKPILTLWARSDFDLACLGCQDWSFRVCRVM
jgi:hypothetical protein